MEDKIRVSIISYLNTIPFLRGIQNSGLVNNDISIFYDFPSECARKLLSGEVDLGIVPVAIIPQLAYSEIISNYCIGANGNVRTVLLVSEVELPEIKTILLDFQSKTSVELVKVLARHFWKISPEWKKTTQNYEEEIKDNTAGVIIGDRTINLNPRYKHVYDLSGEWKKFTGMPFVFACWVANKPLTNNFIEKFNHALSSGIANIEEVIKNYSLRNNETFNVQEYFQNQIDYKLDENKRTAIELFLRYINEENFQK